MEEDNKTPVCRVCLDHIGDTEKCLNLFQKYEDILSPDDKQDNTNKIASKIIAITKVEIIEGDGLPNSICSSCFLELDIAYKFKRKCEKSDDILRIANRCDSDKQEQENHIKQESENELERYYSEEHKILPKLLSYESKQEDTQEMENIMSKNEINKPDENNLNLYEPLLSELQQRDYNNTKGNEVINSIELEFKNKHPTNKDIRKSEDLGASKTNQLKKSKAIDLKLECHDCGSIFNSKRKMINHWKKEHKTVFTCPYCKLQFKSYNSFQNHKKMMTNTCLNASKMRIDGEGKPQVLNYKERECSSKISDNMANQIVHSIEGTFSCDLCTSSYARQQSLRYHKERAHKQAKGHNGTKNYKCNVCSGTFYTASELYKHKKKQEMFAKFVGISPQTP